MKNLFSYLRAFPMRAQTFQFREYFPGGQRLLERGSGVFDDARAALELVHRQAATATGRAWAISSFAICRI